MKKPILAILALILASVACGQYITPTPEAVAAVDTGTPLSPTRTATVPTATPQVIPTDQQAAIVQAVVNVRNAPDGDVIGYLLPGENVTVYECTDEWCRVEQGWIWRGCLSDNPAKLGCSAK